MSNISNPLLRIQTSDGEVRQFCGVTEDEEKAYIVHAHIFRLKSTLKLLDELILLVNSNTDINNDNARQILPKGALLLESPYYSFSQFLKSDIDDAVLRRVQSAELDASVYVSLTANEHFLDKFHDGIKVSSKAYVQSAKMKSDSLLKQMKRETEVAIKIFEKDGYDAFVDTDDKAEMVKKMLGLLDRLAGENE